MKCNILYVIDNIEFGGGERVFSQVIRGLNKERFNVLFWYEPYSFHVNIKLGRQMLLRYFWDAWLGLKDYKRFPTIEDYVNDKIEEAFGTKSWEEAQRICVQRACQNYIPYNPDLFGPYPDLLKAYLESPKYRLKYKDGKIVGRDED